MCVLGNTELVLVLVSQFVDKLIKSYRIYIVRALIRFHHLCLKTHYVLDYLAFSKLFI